MRLTTSYISDGKMCSLTASIVYKYMLGVTPELGDLFLTEHPGGIMCSILSLEDVVECYKEKQESLNSCKQIDGQKFCKCEKCGELKKLYTNLKGRKRKKYDSAEVRPIKLNYRHFDKRGGADY